MSYRYYYLRDVSNTERNGDGSPKTRGVPRAVVKTFVDRQANEIRYSFAIANPKDGFVKSTGRLIVTGRFDKQPITIKGVPGSGHEISKAVLRDLLKQDGIPKRVRKLAEDWLTRADLPRGEQFHTIPAPARAPTMPPIRA